MALELTATISADATALRVTGTVPASVTPGYLFRFVGSDEILLLRSFGKGDIQDNPVDPVTDPQLVGRDRKLWIVGRGQQGTTRAAHLSAAAVEGVGDAFSASDTAVPPGPFPENGGSTTASDVTVPPGLPGDPTNVQEMGAAYAALLPTVDEKAALDGAAEPAADNVFATMADIPAAPTLLDVLGAGNSATNFRITGLDDPIDPLDAANKEYVDGHIGGPTPTLAQVLAAGNDPDGRSIQAGSAGDGTGGSLTVSQGGSAGGDSLLTAGEGAAAARGGYIGLSGGSGRAGATFPASLTLPGGSDVAATHGRAAFTTDGSAGTAGQFVGSDGSDKVLWQTPLIRHAAGVPSGAPSVAELPIAFDSTAVTGGLYYWSGAAWVKVSTIP